jgi:hypothetical protein
VTHDTQLLAQLPARISDCLKDGRPEDATELAAEIIRCPDPEPLRRSLPELDRLFRRGRRHKLLAELLWANKETALNDMYIVGYFMKFCGKDGLYDRFGPMLRSWIAADSTPDFRFSEYGHFRHFRRLTDEQKRDFADAKYRRWGKFASEDFFRAVDEFSPVVNISAPITDFLFDHRRDNTLSFAEWMRAFRSSELLKHIFADMKTINQLKRRDASREARYPRLPDTQDLMDIEKAKSFFGQLDLSKGLLLTTIHDAHLLLAKRCLARCMPERYSLGLHGGRNRIGVGKDGNAHVSAFQAVKVLRGKNVLLIVPDARREVQQTSEVKILGTSRRFADGTPTIAFEAGCATAWYTVVREGDHFVPVCEPGPSREPKESFKAFKIRWWDFYARQVEKLFTGDPRNITLWHFWPKLFGATSDETDDTDEFADDET